MKKKILLVILATIFIASAPVMAAKKNNNTKPVEQLEEVVLETPEEGLATPEVPQSVSSASSVGGLK